MKGADTLVYNGFWARRLSAAEPDAKHPGKTGQKAWGKESLKLPDEHERLKAVHESLPRSGFLFPRPLSLFSFAQKLLTFRIPNAAGGSCFFFPTCNIAYWSPEAEGLWSGVWGRTAANVSPSPTNPNLLHLSQTKYLNCNFFRLPFAY